MIESFKMIVPLSIFLVILIPLSSTLAVNKSVSEWLSRDDHSLSRYEQLINACLMCYKETEIEQGPRRIQGRPNKAEIEDVKKSEVFQMIQRMPKGAALHVHHEFMVDGDWNYNATFSFSDNLYVCHNNGEYRLQFFKKPNNDCDWTSLNELRENPVVARRVNNVIWERMTMIVPYPQIVYPNLDALWTKLKTIGAFTKPLLNYKPVAEAHFYQGLKELYDDRIFYLELRTPIPTLYDLDGNYYNKYEVLHILENITKRFKEEYPSFIGVKIIYSKNSEQTTDEVCKFLDEALELKEAFPNFIAGVDLTAQDETGPHAIKDCENLVQVKEKMRLFFDARRTHSSDSSAHDDLLKAISLKPTRVGHGYPIMKDPEMLKYAKNNKIALEICPISNQILGPVEENHIRSHPVSQLLNEGVPVIIGNDDATVWGARALSYDFYEAFMDFMSEKSNLLALKQLAKNSIIYSSLSPAEQAEALKVWEEKWVDFIKEYVEEEARKKK